MATETATDPNAHRVPSLPDRDVYVYSEYEHGPTDYGRLSAAIKRVSWGAILAGAVLGAVLHFLFHLLGLGIGLETFDPISGDDTVGGFGLGQAIWIVLSGLIALFAAGWVAGRLAGMPRRVDGAVHGLVTWAVATIIALYFLMSGVGWAVSGVTGVVGQGFQLAGQGVAAVAAPAADAAADAAQGVSLSDIEREVRTLLRQTGDPDLRPENLEQQAQQAASAAGAEAQEADIAAAADRAFNEMGEITSELDRQDLVNIIVARTDLTEAEARQAVQQWEGRLAALGRQVGINAETLGEDAATLAEDAADMLGTAALIGFFALLLGALAAAMGGLIGSPHDLPAEAVRRRESATT